LLPALLAPASIASPAGSRSGISHRTGGMGVFQRVSASTILVSSRFVTATILSYVVVWENSPAKAAKPRTQGGFGRGVVTAHRLEDGQTDGFCGVDSNRNPGGQIRRPGWIPIGIL